ncbi:Panacea domain-containing protein [Dyadobacter fermentans]|uniref:Panacea domain-containing protein n=1 Tax=Dyadobacter fermentans TaxID=94254 RepID=UPI001CBEACFC|nr:Panacea domain-containing protein [Dyadobacter fermentans]MBZ1360035.1 SocA family protein [Dyadobacter fermentans]
MKPIAKNTKNWSDDRFELINKMLYVLVKFGGSATYHQIAKALYFAEKEHLRIYGKRLINDSYKKMDFGPVPSEAYDVMKFVGLMPWYKALFSRVDDKTISAVSQPDMDYLAESETAAIDYSIDLIKDLSFKERTDLSHDEAWESAKMNSWMDIKKIAEAGGASEDMIEYFIERNEAAKALAK